MDYLSTEMPLDEKNLGLAGIHYNLFLNDWAYAGIGMYGAVTGTRGGLFTLGVNAGIKKNLFSKLYLDAGLHFGGGGGAGAPDGGGAYILPHFNLGYQFSKFSIETGYSYINFFDNGNIEGHQLNMAVQIPISYDYASFKHAGKELIIDENINGSDWYQESNNLSLLFHFNNLYLLGDTKDKDTGESLKGETIRTVGVELDTYIKNNTFLFIKADGGYHGLPAGYMDIVLGLGYQIAFNKDRTKVLGKFGIGGAGGGGVYAQGGFIIYPDISFEQKIYKNTFLSVNAGFLMNPNASFVASTYGFGLKYHINQNGLISSDSKTFTSAKFKGLEFIVGEEMYFDAERNNAGPQNLQQILLQLNYYLNKNIYVSGQTSFANFGNAGAYAEGIVGGGFSTSTQFSNRIQLFAQILIGAAGGGFVDTGEGLIIKPSAGATFLFNDKLGLRASVGQVKAIDGELNSTFFNIGLNYRLAMLKAN
ncbi:MAG: hypothetical protein ABFR32_11480 [Bacteroidota bacterium]